MNRDPLAAEMLRMRQQLELMQAELLCARAGGPSNTEVQVCTNCLLLELELPDGVLSITLFLYGISAYFEDFTDKML